MRRYSSSFNVTSSIFHVHRFWPPHPVGTPPPPSLRTSTIPKTVWGTFGASAYLETASRRCNAHRGWVFVPQVFCADQGSEVFGRHAFGEHDDVRRAAAAAVKSCAQVVCIGIFSGEFSEGSDLTEAKSKSNGVKIGLNRNAVSLPLSLSVSAASPSFAACNVHWASDGPSGCGF